MAPKTSHINVRIKSPSRLRVLAGSIFIAIGGMIWNFGEGIISRGVRVEEAPSGEVGGEGPGREG